MAPRWGRSSWNVPAHSPARSIWATAGPAAMRAIATIDAVLSGWRMSCLHEPAHAIEQGRRLVSGWLPMVVRFRFEVYRRRAGRIMNVGEDGCDEERERRMTTG